MPVMSTFSCYLICRKEKIVCIIIIVHPKQSTDEFRGLTTLHFPNSLPNPSNSPLIDFLYFLNQLTVSSNYLTVSYTN